MVDKPMLISSCSGCTEHCSLMLSVSQRLTQRVELASLEFIFLETHIILSMQRHKQNMQSLCHKQIHLQDLLATHIKIFQSQELFIYFNSMFRRFLVVQAKHRLQANYSNLLFDLFFPHHVLIFFWFEMVQRIQEVKYYSEPSQTK